MAKNKKKCETCKEAFPAGEGCILCFKYPFPVLVIDEYIPTDNYLCCESDGKEGEK